MEINIMKAKKLLLSTLIAGVVGLGGATAYAAGSGNDAGCGGKQHGGHHMKHSGGKHGKSGERGMERMTKKLGLSDDQKQQVKSFKETNKEKMKPLREKMKELRTSLRSLDPASVNYEAELNTIATEKADLERQLTVAKGQNRQQFFNMLTPEQQVKMKEAKAQRKQRNSN